MVMCGAGWGGMEMKDAEIRTKLREGEIRGGETEIMGRADWGPEERDG